MTRTLRLFIALLVLPSLAMAQDERPGRPNLLAAVGLLEQAPFSVDEKSLGKPVSTPFSLILPSSQSVGVRTQTDVEGAILAVEFGTVAGAFVESAVFTAAQVSAGPDEQRLFAMANLLVLKSFPSLAENFPDARIAGFGPVDLGDVPAVQLVGTYTGPNETPVVFRHVGFLPGDSDDVVVALVNIAATAMPVPNNEALDDTYTGWLLDSVRFGPSDAE